MKKIKNLFMLAFVALAFVACSDNEDVTDTGGGKIDPNGESWISLSLAPAGGNSMARALNGTDQETGKANESNVESVRVILFDGYDEYSSVTNDITIAKADVSVSNQIISTNAVKVSNSAKSILVIVNPSSKLPATGSFTTYAQFNVAINNVTLADVIGSNEDQFMMTNAKGGNDITTYAKGTKTGLEPSKSATDGSAPGESDGTALSEHMHPTAAAAESDRVKLKVDRVVSKVRLYNNHKDPTGTNVGLIVSDVEWVLNVTNKKFFPVSKRTYTYLENLAIATNYTNWFNNDKVWSDQYGFGSYRIDPNYTNYTGGTGGTQIYTESGGVRTYIEPYISDFYFYQTEPAASVWKAPTNTGTSTNPPVPDPETPSNDKNNPIYCLENTQNKAGNYHAFTTHAQVRANIYPSHFRDIDLTDGTTSDILNNGLDKTDGWIKVSTGFYSFTTLNKWIKYELYGKYTSLRNGVDSPTTITSAYLKYLKDFVGIDIVLPDWNTFSTKYTLNASSTNDAVKAAVDLEIPELFISDGASGGTTAIDLDDLVAGTTDIDNGFTFYAGGLSYYNIMIKHDDKDGDAVSNELGEFGVVRNSVYDINITNFKNPGYPTIILPDPTKPDEGDTFIAFEIEVNKWTWYTQNVEL